MMTIEQALSDLGAADSALSSDEKATLDRDGFIQVRGLISREQARALADHLDVIAAAEGDRAGLDFHTEKGATRLGSLMNKDHAFDICFLHPKALAIVAYITEGNFGLSSLTARTALPGEGHQGLHCDWQAEIEPGKVAPHPTLRAANVLWLLDDFTEENGPTRIVPGSHRWLTAPEKQMDPLQDHPDQIRLLAPAGTMVVLNAYTWHAGTVNRSSRPRHLISAMFQPRGMYQSFAYRKLHAPAQMRLSRAARFIADHDES
jgi:ectoine hydroxylase-related dioxygenase (phytanoyl-CoA dioxygenase family)